MNRLWIRLSLLFTAVVVVAVLAITLTVRLTSNGSRDSENPPPPEVVEYFESQRRTDFAPDVTVVAIVVGVIAISAGVWMSRSLTKPLSELEDGAGAIAGQDLSHRVPVHGSQEMVAVAIAFNNMAAQLEQEEKLRRNLLADVTHELRHPVHILQGNLQAILDDVYPLNKDEIMRLVDQTQHLSVLVNDLHVLAQAEAQQLPLFKQETDIATLVKQTASSFNPLASARNIDLRVELLGTMPEKVTIDRARMRQAIHNLLDNALRHTPNGGTITVSVEQVQGNLQIWIADTGEGIPADQLPYVFERFYRIDKARSRDRNSTGLGLAIVKAIVEAHESSITVTSPGSGQGSVFIISMPLERT